MLTQMQGYEMPAINPARRTLQHRYVYATGLFDPGLFCNAVSAGMGRQHLRHVREAKSLPSKGNMAAAVHDVARYLHDYDKKLLYSLEHVTL